MNKDIFQGKIKEISGEIKKKWGVLTDNEILQTKGDIEALSGLVQKKVGLSKDQASKQVNELMSAMDKKYGSDKGKGTEKLPH
ncbi:MAG: CsbD family protein [Pseudobdellovibrionaceae bacterium]